MSTTNVMSVSSQAAAPAKVPDSKAGSRTGKKTNAADDSFDEALGKANTDSKQAAGDVSADTKGSKDDKDSKDENPKNPLAAILAALQQGNGKNEGSKTELAQPQLAGEPATVLAISDTAKGQFVNTAQAAAAVQSNLQSLIPQAAADGVKSQDFLAMLSGQQLKGAKQQGQVPLLQGNLLEAAVPAAQTMQAPLTNDQKGTVVQQAAGTVLEAQLVNTQTAGSQNPPQSGLATGTPVVQPKMESVAGGTAVPPQSGLVAGAPAAQAPAAQALAVQAPVAQQAPAAQALAVQAPAGADLVAQAAGSTNLPQTAQAPAAAKLSEGPVSVKDLLDGAPLAVEDKTQTAPLHIEGQKSMNQPGSQSQQNGQGEAQHQTLLSGAGIKLAQQLPEEAAADRAPVSKTPDNAQNSSVSMFQQGLQDSIRGTAANHLQSSQPQPAQNDYNIPRQIVDQARLIRTKLKPEHLGELTLKVSVSQNGSVNASFHSENAQVRTAIENSLVQLRQELNNQGLKVDSVEVYAGLADGQLPQDQGQQAWQNNQQGGTAKIRNVQLGADEYNEDTEVLSAVLQSKENTAMEGVDYRI